MAVTAVVTVDVANLEPVKVLLYRLMALADEARYVHQQAGLANDIEDALITFAQALEDTA